MMNGRFTFRIATALTCCMLLALLSAPVFAQTEGTQGTDQSEQNLQDQNQQQQNQQDQQQQQDRMRQEQERTTEERSVTETETQSEGLPATAGETHLLALMGLGSFAAAWAAQRLRR